MLTISRPYRGGRGAEADRLMVKGGATAQIEWEMPPPDLDVPIASPDTETLAAALLRAGRLAFRADPEDARPHPGITYHPEPRLPLAVRFGARIWPRDSNAAFGLIITDQRTAALSLFSFGGWGWGVQAVLAYDPAISSESEIAAALSRGLDWRNRHLPHGASLLLGTGHDGAFAIIAAATEAALAKFAHDCQDLASDTILTGF